LNPAAEQPPVQSDAVDCRVAALTHYLPPYMARALFHLSRSLRDLQVLLSIAQEPNRQFGENWEGLKVTVQRSVMMRRPWKHASGFQDELYIHFPYDTLGQLRRIDPDVVFSYELGFRSLTSALYCRRHRKQLALCVCVSEHTEQGRGALRKILRQYLLKKADAVTYNGPSCLDYLRQFGIADSKLFHFPYASSDQFCYTGPLKRSPQNDARLLSVGQLTQRKGVVPMVETLADYCLQRPERTLELELVGTGPLEETLRHMRLPSNFRMRLHGHLDYGQLDQLMSNSGILVFPTWADEWGLVVNEAMQAGLPVLGSQFAQASCVLIRDGINGWLYSPLDGQQMHQKLDLFFSLSADGLLTMRQAAQESVRHITSQNVALQAAQMFRYLRGSVS
jgi:glycosyltransferase involved in cell wall biosynthesis